MYAECVTIASGKSALPRPKRTGLAASAGQVLVRYLSSDTPTLLFDSECHPLFWSEFPRAL